VEADGHIPAREESEASVGRGGGGFAQYPCEGDLKLFTMQWWVRRIRKEK
jgi:hypothetical protein